MFFENPNLNAVTQGAALGGALGASVGTQPALIRSSSHGLIKNAYEAHMRREIVCETLSACICVLLDRFVRPISRALPVYHRARCPKNGPDQWLLVQDHCTVHTMRMPPRYGFYRLQCLIFCVHAAKLSTTMHNRFCDAAVVAGHVEASTHWDTHSHNECGTLRTVQVSVVREPISGLTHWQLWILSAIMDPGVIFTYPDSQDGLNVDISVFSGRSWQRDQCERCVQAFAVLVGCGALLRR